MKKLLFATLILASFISSAFAAPTKKVSYIVRNAFQAAFPEATGIEWNVTAEYSKATFVVDDVKTEAFYNSHGDYIGSSHAVSMEKLPINVKRTLARNYSNYTVTEAIQFDSAEEAAYFVSAKNDKHSIILKVVNGAVSLYKYDN